MSHRPSIDSTLASRLASAHFGLGGPVRELVSYADRNFLVEGDSPHVLKISAGPQAAIEMEQMAMRLLADFPEGPATPAIRLDPRGNDIVVTRDRDGAPCFARAISFLPGRLLADQTERPPQLWRDLGASAAAIDQGLSRLEHPALDRDFRWNLGQASWISEHLRAFTGARRDWLASVLLQFRSRALPRFPELDSGPLHNDLNDHNVLVDVGSDGPRISGVFDFGDMVRGPYVAELAITCAYAMLGADDPVGVASEIGRGYHQVRPLRALELDLLLDLVATRLAVSVTSSTLARQAEPENAYLDVTEPQAWSLLKRLVAHDRVEATRRIFDRCEVDGPTRYATGKAGIIRASRDEHMSQALSLSYSKPLYIARGQGTYLFDQHDHGLLDCVNNVCHVGHCHPGVVAAAVRQIGTLNTNTRYLHEHVAEYARRLAATFPDPLNVCFFVTSGSEANELALRLARAHTGGQDVIVVDAAYHGNTGNLVDMSPYKYDGPGGRGRSPWVHVLPTPDPYRGQFGDDGARYAAVIDEIAADVHASERRLAAFFCESAFGCAGQVFPASGFMSSAYSRSRAAGAVVVADEVQVGFGRVGHSMWAFERHDVMPDIVTLGKPIGNGHPMGAVVTTPAIAASFDGGMEFFSTFGGNPVSAATGLAVLDAIRDEELQAHALEVGDHLLDRLRDLANRHSRIGDVRGEGLFQGLELVCDRNSKDPDPTTASAVVEFARAQGVLLSVDGPEHNVIKIKPPLVFGHADADLLADTIDRGLSSTQASPES